MYFRLYIHTASVTLTRETLRAQWTSVWAPQLVKIDYNTYCFCVKMKDSILSLYKWANTAFWHCKTNFGGLHRAVTVTPGMDNTIPDGWDDHELFINIDE